MRSVRECAVGEMLCDGLTTHIGIRMVWLDAVQFGWRSEWVECVVDGWVRGLGGRCGRKRADEDEGRSACESEQMMEEVLG